MAKARSTEGALARASPEPDTSLMVLSCMEMQLDDTLALELARRGLGGRLDHISLAGASLGAVTSRFPHWGRTFYEHLALARALHGVTRVVLVDHRHCSVYERLLNVELTDDADKERSFHLAHQQKLRRKIHALDPSIQVSCWLLDGEGQVEDLSAEPDLWLPGITERRRKPRTTRPTRGARKAAASRARARR